MAQNDEVIRLLLDMGVSKENVQEVSKALDQLVASSKAVKDSYEVLDARTGTYSVSTSQLATAEDKAVAAALEQTRAQKALAEVLEQAGTASDKAKSKVAGFGQSALQTGRVIQDFTQGGIGGILNNLEGLSMALGGGPGLAGVLTLLGVAAFVAGPQIKQFWADLAGGFREKIPGATDDLGKLAEAIKRNRDELEKLREKQELSLIEGQKYRDLVRETTDLEAKQANARAAQSVSIYDNKADRARASAFREAVGEFGGGEELVKALMAAGLDRTSAEGRVADALKGDKLQIQNILNRAPAFRGAYTSPEDAEAKKREAEEHNRALEAFDRQQAQAKKEQDQADEIRRKAQDQAGKEARKKAADAARLGPLPAAAARQVNENGKQVQAAMIEQQVIRRGGATQKQAAQLAALEKELGPKMVSFDEAQAMMQLSQTVMGWNQATFQQRLAEARRVLAQVREVTTQQNQTNAAFWGPG